MVRHLFFLLFLAESETDPAEAEPALRRALTLPAQPPGGPRVDPGAFLFRQGRLPGAATLLTQAVTSNSPRAHLELGRVLLQQGIRKLP